MRVGWSGGLQLAGWLASESERESERVWESESVGEGGGGNTWANIICL